MGHALKIAAETAEPFDLGRAALEYEFARRRQLNNIPDRHMTPTWLELAIAKDWTPRADGSFSEVRVAAEAAVRGGRF